MAISNLLKPAAGLGLNSTFSLFTFGDSYTWTGFNSSLEAPSIDNPMGNPGLGEETATDGVNWLGYVVSDFNESMVLSYNFAAYGATVDNAVVAQVPRDMVHQVDDFNEHYCGQHGAWDTETSIFGLWFGINDVYLSSSPSVHRREASPIEAVVQSYTRLFHDLQACGARRFFVLNVPPITRSPAMLASSGSHREIVRQRTSEFNFQLHRAVGLWNHDRPNARISFYDAWEFMDHILDHPELYGFRDSSCIGAGCIWWDDFHPMSAFHRLLAKDLQSKLHI